jgi:hypothetical protein
LANSLSTFGDAVEASGLEIVLALRDPAALVLEVHPTGPATWVGFATSVWNRCCLLHEGWSTSAA